MGKEAMKSTFIGTAAAQSPGDFRLWEEFLAKTSFSRIIEIGTYKWGMSLFFFLWCKTKKASFHTYDIKFFPSTRVVRELGITRCFNMLDVFKYKEDIGRIIGQPGTTILFCDGGNKPKELLTFSKYLKPGDFVAVHDWGTEVKEYDVPLGLVPVASGGMTAIFHA